MRVIVATAQCPFVRGGAEILTEGLRGALVNEGHEAEVVAIPFKWYPAENILTQMLACRLMDLIESDSLKIDCLIGLKFPAYLIPHPRKVLWVMHQHRPAYDLWDKPLGDLATAQRGREVREAIRRADEQTFNETQKVFAISRNVTLRLKKYSDVHSIPLYHPPLGANLFYNAEAHNYIFFPSRCSPTKRQLLVVEALARTRCPVQVRFASSSNHPRYTEEVLMLVDRLGLNDRVALATDVTEEEKRRLYAHALAVIYPPVDEDYGYVTLEAMLASKPVITCWDSGGPLEFVTDKETGLIAEATPESLAYVMDELWANRAQAKRMGLTGRDRYQGMGITWKSVVERLLS